MIDVEQINQFFSLPETSEGQKLALAEVMRTALAFAESLNINMPDGEDKAQVINSLRQAVLTAELAIRYRYKSSISLVKGVN